MPNALAYLVLYGWPLITAILFFRLSMRHALPWSLVAGYLLLPDRFGLNLPLLPTYNKDFAAAAAALALCLATQNRQGEDVEAWRETGWLPQSTVMRFLLALFLIQPVLTVLTNLDPAPSGARVLPGMSFLDLGAAVYTSAVAIIPFLLARRYLTTAEGLTSALRIIALAGLAYSLLIAFELRFSPQLNRMVYGYTHFQWVQQLRNGGYRPVVFLQHGLWTAIFTATALICAAAVWRGVQGTARSLWMAATLWLATVLAVSNSFGALAIGLPMALAVRFAPARLTLLIAAVAGTMAITYPMLRSVGLVPTASLISAAESVSVGRALSLKFRFDNEDALLERANERALFGWGGWGRSRLYDEESGTGLSITDGRWIIVFGSGGWAGYLAEFGLLCLPLLMAARRRDGAPPAVAVGLSAALAANLVDMLLNGTLTPVTWMLAGLMTGYAEGRYRNPAVVAIPSNHRRRPRPVFGAVS